MTPDKEAHHYRNFMGVIRKSPFGELVDHNTKIKESVDLLSKMLDVYMEGDFEKAKSIAKKISYAEYEADQIKGNLRMHLPKGIFMPIDRGDVLAVLHEQDEVADYAEDVAELMTMKDTVIPEDLKGPLKEHFQEIYQTVQKLYEAVKELTDILESSFAKKEINVVLKLIEDVNKHEHNADKIEKKISRSLFQKEYDIDTLTTIHLLKIVDRADQIANKAEATGNRIRTMLAR